MPIKVPIVSKIELETLHTGSLLSRLERLRKCEESFRLSDKFGYEEEPDLSATGYIEFKDTDAWKQAYSELKEILTDREHIPSAAERRSRGRS